MRGVKLLMTTSQYENWTLPDFISRINATYSVLIKSPDESMIKLLLVKMLSDLQIKVDMAVIDYASVRLQRSFSAVHQFVRDANYYSMVHKRAITIPLIKETLGV
jgi:chromosomal replication initiation ATPase DnaA